MESSPQAATTVAQASRGNLILVLGLASFFAGPLAGIPAFVMGVRELWNVSRGHTDPRERGRTLAGIIAGIIGTIIFTLMLFIIMLAVQPPERKERERYRSPIVQAPTRDLFRHDA